MIMPRLLMALTSMFAVAVGHVPTTAALPDDKTQSLTVQYSDLDLTRQKDRNALEARINRAARSICGRPFHLQTTAELQCLYKTVRSARSQRNAAIARALQPLAGGEWWISPTGAAAVKVSANE
jgi:UrcA family protein